MEQLTSHGTNVRFISHIHVRFWSCVISLVVLRRCRGRPRILFLSSLVTLIRHVYSPAEFHDHVEAFGAGRRHREMQTAATNAPEYGRRIYALQVNRYSNEKVVN